jgi:hypothetical protein
VQEAADLAIRAKRRFPSGMTNQGKLCPLREWQIGKLSFDSGMANKDANDFPEIFFLADSLKRGILSSVQ